MHFRDLIYSHSQLTHKILLKHLLCSGKRVAQIIQGCGLNFSKVVLWFLFLHINEMKLGDRASVGSNPGPQVGALLAHGSSDGRSLHFTLETKSKREKNASATSKMKTKNLRLLSFYKVYICTRDLVITRTRECSNCRYALKVNLRHLQILHEYGGLTHQVPRMSKVIM